MNSPHSVISEHIVIGSIFFDNENIKLIEERLSPKDFFVPINAAAYSACLELYREGKGAWPHTVLVKLQGTPFESDSGVYFGDIAAATVGEGKRNIVQAAHMVYSLARQRELIGLSKSLISASEVGDAGLIERAQKAICDVGVNLVSRPQPEPLEQLQSAMKTACKPQRMLLTGVYGWDVPFGGLMPGARYIIAGKGGEGKTALAVNIGWNLAKAGKKVRYIFFEGTVEEIWHRIMSRETRTPITSFRKGLTENQQYNVNEKQAKVVGANFAVVRDPRDVYEMIELCGRTDCIVLDGMSSAPAKGDTLIERVADVSRYSKILADRTGAAVIMLSHMNSGGVKAGGDGTALYGGQAPTFDPEGIMELKPGKDQSFQQGIRNIDGVISKNRYGGLSTVRFTYEGEYMTYGDTR